MSGKDSEIEMPDDAAINLVSGNITTTESVVESSSFWKKMNGIRMSSDSARQWLNSRRQKMKPWLQFFNFGNFSRPDTPSKWSKRLMRNIEHFQTNYVCVFIVLFIYCLLTSPLLLIALGAIAGACHLLHVRQSERPLVIAGRQVSLSQQYMGVALLSIPLFAMVGASSALFWVLGASMFVVLMHASFYRHEALTGDDGDDNLFEVTMEPV